jgi:hypothetical protein
MSGLPGSWVAYSACDAGEGMRIGHEDSNSFSGKASGCFCFYLQPLAALN